jgi:hypothetical protein
LSVNPATIVSTKASEEEEEEEEQQQQWMNQAWQWQWQWQQQRDVDDDCNVSPLQLSSPLLPHHKHFSETKQKTYGKNKEYAVRRRIEKGMKKNGKMEKRIMKNKEKTKEIEISEGGKICRGGNERKKVKSSNRHEINIP